MTSKVDVIYQKNWQHGSGDTHGFHSFAVLEIGGDEKVVVKSRNVVDVGYQIFVKVADDSDWLEVSEPAEKKARNWARSNDGIPDGIRMTPQDGQNRFVSISG